MNNKEKHLEQLQDIKSMMERSSRFISLSGFSGIFAGFYAILGALAVYFKFFGSFSYKAYRNRFPMDISIEFIFFMILIALVVLILSISTSIYFTTKKARKQNLPLWDDNAFKTIINLLVPLTVGGVFCLILIYHSLHVNNLYISLKMIGLVAPTTLVFYGLALYNAGKYTLDEIRYLGVSEIILGLLGCIFIGYGLLFWILGFGVLHIFYGFIMWWKYERVLK